jgi:hypothetical protein
MASKGIAICATVGAAAFPKFEILTQSHEGWGPWVAIVGLRCPFFCSEFSCSDIAVQRFICCNELYKREFGGNHVCEIN